MVLWLIVSIIPSLTRVSAEGMERAHKRETRSFDGFQKVNHGGATSQQPTNIHTYSSANSSARFHAGFENVRITIMCVITSS